MNKKGFTLVEVLAILAVLGVMIMLIFPNIGGSLDAKKDKELEKIINIVESAGKAYFSFNDDTYKIPISTLKDEDYITTDISNPKTNEKLDGCVRVTLDNEDIYTYTYGSCETIEVPLIVELNGGTTTQNFVNTYNDFTKIELIDPIHSEADFTGWKIAKGNSILKGNTLVIGTTETVLYAMWDVWVKLDVNLNGGSTTQNFNESYKSGSTIKLEVPTKEGYTFMGWNIIEGNSVISGNIFTMGSENTVIEAIWEMSTYTITYNLNNGTILENPTSYTVETDNIVLNNPTRIGYTFRGWTGSNGTTPSTSVTISKGSTGNKTYTANWSANTYTITYYIGNGTSTAGAKKLGTSTCAYDSSCTLKSFTDLGGIFPHSSADNTTNGKTNYYWSFYGWGTSTSDTSRNYANAATFTYTKEGNLNLYGIGRKTYYINSGIAPTATITNLYQYWNPYSINATYLTSITLPNFTAISGWTFIGYKGGSNTANETVTYDSTKVETVVKPEYNLTWNIMRSVYKRTLTLKYAANGGSGTVSNSTAVQYYNSGYASSGANTGAKVSTPTFTLRENSFKKTNYSFSKWAAGSTSGTQYAEGASYTGFAPAVDNTTTSKTMYAIWKVNNTIPVFTYTGDYEIVDDNNKVITTSTGNWKIRFLTGGTLIFTDLRGAANGIDVFLVGGGGGAVFTGTGYNCGGGGGGYTKTKKGVSVTTTSYEIIIGSGGEGVAAANQTGGRGGTTSAFGQSAEGGYGSGGGGYNVGCRKGGDGGSGGGGQGCSTDDECKGGSDGSNGFGPVAGQGQGTTTREFGETSGKLYSSGGGGSMGGGRWGVAGTGSRGDNTGAGGNTQYPIGQSGFSGIVVIRNKR